MSMISAITSGNLSQSTAPGEKTVVEENAAAVAESSASSDPSVWVDLHGDYLFRYALMRLRDEAVAEDLVQETLLAALQSCGKYAGNSSERTWLTGILKHKIFDYFRRHAKNMSFREVSSDFSDFEQFFQRDDEWDGHWNERFAPTEWPGTPEQNLEREEFRAVLNNCLSKLPDREAYVFTMREVDGLTGKEICEVLNISSSNFWVIIHRARMNLRRCIELKWFKGAVSQ